jgi:hypothetical protein
LGEALLKDEEIDAQAGCHLKDGLRREQEMEEAPGLGLPMQQGEIENAQGSGWGCESG